MKAIQALGTSIPPEEGPDGLGKCYPSLQLLFGCVHVLYKQQLKAE